MSKNDENKKSALEKLLKKINLLMIEVSSVKHDKRELEKAVHEMTTFLKNIPVKNPLNKQASELVTEIRCRLDPLTKK